MSYCWKKTFISKTTTIQQALEIINDGALRVAIVVDCENRLLGMVTDGDVRRGLLSNLALSDSVSLIMNSQPICALEGTTKENLVELMEEKQILSVPIVNQERMVVGLETLHGALTKNKFDNPVFIMAGGFGTRLRPLTDNCPKPMLKVGDKPILETQIRSFIKAGYSNFYISTHYMPEQIRQHFGDGSDYDVSISYVHEERPLGTGGALGLLPDEAHVNLPIIMINGDILTKVDYQRLMNFHLENDADATMCVREYDYQVPYGVINSDGNRITGMIEKPTQRFFVNAGIYVLSPKIVQSVAKNQKIDMPSLLDTHRVERDRIFMFPIHEYWLDVGQMDDFKKAQVDILTLDI